MVIITNLPNEVTLFEEGVMCLIAVNSFSFIMIVFSLLNQFICAPDDAKQQEENLSQGIYLIFIAIFTFLLTNMVVKIDS
jgi:hypothetical protein